MRVLLADDHRLMLDGIRRALDDDGGFEVVGETQNGAQVLPLVGQTNPDLVVLDVRMPNMVSHDQSNRFSQYNRHRKFLGSSKLLSVLLLTSHLALQVPSHWE
jgi:DNA-binding NarL/FixJ family response regulator